MTKIISSQLYLILFLKDENRKKKTHENPSSDALSQDPIFCLTFLIPTPPQIDSALKTRCTKPLGMCTSNIPLSYPHQFPVDSMIISTSTQNHFFFFLLC